MINQRLFERYITGNPIKFEEMKVEIFEFEGKVLFNPRDIGEVLGMSDKTVLNHLSSMNDKKKVKLTNSNSPLTGIRNVRIHTREKNLYLLRRRF